MNTFKKLIIITIIAAFFASPMFLYAQNPPHPNGGSGPTGGNTPVGGGAPVGSGLIILVSLAMGYGAKKTFNVRKMGHK